MNEEPMDDYTQGMLSAQIQLVDLGARTAAHVMVTNEYVETALDILEERNIFIVVQRPVAKTHRDLIFFKKEHEHLREIITLIAKLDEPLRSWAYGKFYGYSEEKIGSYLKGIPKELKAKKKSKRTSQA